MKTEKQVTRTRDPRHPERCIDSRVPREKGFPDLGEILIRNAAPTAGCLPINWKAGRVVLVTDNLAT